MVNLKTITDFLDTVAPPALCEDYDNVGLLVGDRNKGIESVLITLDVDMHVAEEAKEKNIDLIISHHPLIFKALDRITTEDAGQRTVLSLASNDIALFSMHTNFDSVSLGLGDLFLDTIAETKNRTPVEGEGKDGIGRIAELSNPTCLSDLLETVKKAFSLPSVRYIGDENKAVSKLAVVNGGGAEYVSIAKELGADCFISGDFKYHQARFAYENEIAAIEVPHYSAEFIFCKQVKELLSKQFGDSLNLLISEKNVDIWKQHN